MDYELIELLELLNALRLITYNSKPITVLRIAKPLGNLAVEICEGSFCAGWQAYPEGIGLFG